MRDTMKYRLEKALRDADLMGGLATVKADDLRRLLFERFPTTPPYGGLGGGHFASEPVGDA